MFADVILPLPVAGCFTYSLPVSFEEKVQVGCRIIVPFGSKKFYSAIVIRIHNQKPDCAIKVALELLDECPFLLPSQLKLWKWIADYYICTEGEVYKAALPSGLKLESESVVVYSDDFVADGPLPHNEQCVLDALSLKQELSLSSLQKETRIRSLLPVVKRLLEKGAVLMKEEVKRSYRPKVIPCVRLAEEFFSEARLNQVLDEMRRSPKQVDLLLKYLDISCFSSALTLHNRQLLKEVTKSELMKTSGSTPAVFNGLKARGVFEIYEKVIERASSVKLPAGMTMFPLSAAQQIALDGIKYQLKSHNVCLLHGVTSSGKTEIYIHLIAEILKQGKQVLYLLPEIVLTTQLTNRLKRVFGDRLGVYHSRYPDAERVEVYQKMLSDRPYDILVGVRSSVFLPFRNLGLVIVDEEHETSFKQQDPAPRYHARNVALMLAAQMGAKTLLGTATPSLESYSNALAGKYGLVKLMTRYKEVLLPEIQVVDIKELQRKKMMNGPFSPQLLYEMREALKRHLQIILFQNRRGFAPLMECKACGWVPRCQNCDVSLTYHKGSNRLTCHYCGAVYRLPTVCPCCESHEMSSHGYGTERIENHIQALFPEARIARMDLDTTRSRQSYEQILYDFQHGLTDILVGTQMVTKGLDFDRVSVVGILDAGTMLNLPDFRSYERAFQMMAQVAGRAGRRNVQGRVILQTKDPSVSIISQVVGHDYDAMYAEQIRERQAFNFPPNCRLIYVFLKHRDEHVLEQLALDLIRYMRQVFGHRVFGPDIPFVSRVQMLFIRKVILKIEYNVSQAEVRKRLRQIQKYLLDQPQYKSAQVYYDVDPQ